MQLLQINDDRFINLSDVKQFEFKTKGDLNRPLVEGEQSSDPICVLYFEGLRISIDGEHVETLRGVLNNEARSLPKIAKQNETEVKFR